MGEDMTKTQQYKLNVKRRKKLLKLWSSEGRLHACCYLCETTERLQAHHFFSKKMYKALRFDVSNRVILCCSCHSFKGKTSDGSFHMSPEAVVNWAETNETDYNYLCAHKNNDIDLDDTEVLDRLEECILSNTPYWT
jgi:5-methylcytosine-specific restriction endonuclease McrA